MRKILAAVAAVLIIILIFFIYSVVENRYFRDEPKTILNNFQKEELQGENNSESYEDSDRNNDSEENEIAPKDIEIISQDCDNQCQRFEKDNELEYCEQVCGISDLYEQDYEKEDKEGELSVDCSGAKGVKKDYCLKDEAISQNDFKICDQIRDGGVKKTCQNRITESLLESQNISE